MRAKVISNKSSANFLRVTISTLMLLVAVSLRQHPLTDLLFEIFYILVTLNFLVTLPYLIFISQQLTDFTKYGVLFASFLSFSQPDDLKKADYTLADKTATEFPKKKKYKTKTAGGIEVEGCR